MTHGRRPTQPPSDLADPLDEDGHSRAYALTPAMEDELSAPHRVGAGTRPVAERTPSGRFKPSGVPEREPYYDAAPEDADSPENVDLHGRVSLLEQLRRDADARIKAAHVLAESSGTWNRRIFYALSGLAGVAGTALVFAFSVARSNGDATGEKRARDVERARYIMIIDQLVRDVSRHDGILGGLVDAVRSHYPIGALPLIGPPRHDEASDP